jgi:5'-3' exonuclease
MVETPRKSLALVDLSWDMYRNRFHYRDYGYPSYVIDDNGNQTSETYIRPTGHIYGVIQDVFNLTKNYSLVVLAVDSYTKWRKALLPCYKEGRHIKTGDPSLDFPVRTDISNILALCSYIKKCVYIYKMEPDGYEADDLLASFLYASRHSSDEIDAFPVSSFDVSLYASDVDVLQTPGHYLWFRNFNEPPTDRVKYLEHKLSLSGRDYLPQIWKTVTGDSSDKIPPGILRYPRKILQSICSSLDYTFETIEQPYDFETYVSLLQSYGSGCGGSIKTQLQQLDDPKSETYKRLKVNYMVTKPWLTTIRYSDLYKDKYSFEEVKAVLEGYQLHSLIPQFSVIPS